MFKVSFHVRQCLIPAFNVSDPRVPFIRVPIGSSSPLCCNERKMYEIGVESVCSREKQQSFVPSLQTVSLLGLFSPKQGQSFYQLPALLAVGLSSGAKQLSRSITECNLSFFHVPHQSFLPLNSSYSHYFELKFSCGSPPSFQPSSSMAPPILLIRFSLDNLRKKQLLCLFLLSIVASAAQTTGFICWRRATFDTGASQAGLPLSPAQALFPVAEGAERVFNEIQTLGMRSHRHLRTSLPLTSVATCGDQKTLNQAAQRNFAPVCECTMMMRNNGRLR